MILVDTSIWIGWIRQRIDFGAVSIRQMVICPPILQEILQGIDDTPVLASFRETLMLVPRLDDPVPIDAFLEAAEIYRDGRRRGITIRSSVDCLIAAIAIRHGATIFHQDRDFEQIARFRGLRTRSAARMASRAPRSAIPADTLPNPA